MKKLLLFDGYKADLTSCPDEIADNLEQYILRFDDWLEEDGRFLVHEAGETGYSFSNEDVVDWFNDVVLTNAVEKLSYIKTNFRPSRHELKKYPVFYV